MSVKLIYLHAVVIYRQTGCILLDCLYFSADKLCLRLLIGITSYQECHI